MCVYYMLIYISEMSTPMGGCSHGSVRLVNGTEYGGGKGRLEVCINNAWGTVCGNNFGDTDATVVCRQLAGFSAVGMLFVKI